MHNCFILFYSAWKLDQANEKNKTKQVSSTLYTTGILVGLFILLLFVLFVATTFLAEAAWVSLSYE